LFVAVDTVELEAHQRVEPPAAHGASQLQGDGHVVAELLLPVGMAHQPAIAVRHVAGVEVEQRHLETGVLDGAHDVADILARRPPELHAGESRLGGATEALGEVDFLEQHGKVGAEAHVPSSFDRGAFIARRASYPDRPLISSCCRRNG
jgi:hypothetical protein